MCSMMMLYCFDNGLVVLSVVRYGSCYIEHCYRSYFELHKFVVAFSISTEKKGEERKAREIQIIVK